MDEILRDLNDAQRAAVTHRGTPLLVVAGAGSGKTRVITRRVAHLVRAGVSPHRVLAITFTNKAANEMKERVQKLLPLRPTWISTFHSFGARLLRIEAAAAGVDPNFTILDASDQLVVMKEVLKELKLGNPENRPRDYLAFISDRKNANEPPPAADETVHDVFERAYRGYERMLASQHAVDFDDLLLKPLRVLSNDAATARRWSERFDVVLVDEYQDTNRVQYELLRRLAGPHTEVCATGDPDQSIYRWRGADIRNILEFESDFPGTRVVKLEENYRSTNRILRAATAVISNNKLRVERDLRSSLGEGESLRLLAGDSDTDESQRVVAAIRAAIDEGARPSEIAVLYRTNACSRTLEAELRRANLPYRIVGAVEFYERREVKDLIAYLRVVVNPHDSLDLLRVLNVPSRGIGAKSVERLVERAAAETRPLRDVVMDPFVHSEMKGNARAGLEDFARLLFELVNMPRTPVAPILDRILLETNYRAFLEELADPLTEERLENVEELRRALFEFDLARPDATLEDFLQETTLIRSRDDRDEAADRVTLMTIHSAKGLEFPIVHVTALEEGLLPHARSIGSDEDLEEERRLLYVAITRAQRRLTLSYARRRTGFAGGFETPSRFLDEIPRDLIEFDASVRPGIVAEPIDGAWYEPESDGAEPPFEEGDRVVHQHFGVGRVLGLSGFGRTAKVTVDFDDYGEKRLVLEYANLRKAAR